MRQEKSEGEGTDLEDVVELGKGVVVAHGEDEVDEEDREEGESDAEDGELGGHRVGESGQDFEVGIRAELVHAHRDRPNRSERRRHPAAQSQSVQWIIDKSEQRRSSPLLINSGK